MKKHITQRATTASSVLSIAPLALTGITTIIGLILSSSVVSATNDSVVDEVSITVPVSCTMSGAGMNTHNADIANGIYTPDIGTTTLHAFCNDSEGFSIYAAGYTGNEIGATNSNKLVGTTASGNSVIESGTATSAGSPDVSNWAMKLAITQDSGDTTSTNAFTIDSAPNVDLPSQAEQGATSVPFSDYHTVPNECTKVAHKNSMTDMTETTGGVKLTTTYAAYISKTQPADTYTGQVIYTLVHPASAAAPVVCNPNGTTIGTDTSTDIVCMQDITSTNKSSVLASMTDEAQYTLIDKRDEKSYTIAKLADGKVWMTQNLDLNLDSNTTYTNLDTDLGWDTQTNSYQTASWTPIRSTYTATSDQTHEWCVSGTQDSYGYCENNNTPESYDPGNLYWNGDAWPDDDGDSCRAAGGTFDWEDVGDYSFSYCDGANLISSTGNSHYHLGNYYNWAAAIASNDTSVYGIRNETTGQYENLEARQSICPVGWTLPYVSGDGLTSDFATLWGAYGWTENNGFSDISTISSAPFHYSFSSGFGGVLLDVGYSGSFWSSTANDGYRVRRATFDHKANIVTPVDISDQSFGISVRCLLR